MKFSALTTQLGIQTDIEDFEVNGVFSDSRRVVENSVFVCIDGTKTDGHQYAHAAAKAGAKAVFVQRDTGMKNQIIVPDTREYYANMCAALQGNPSRELKLIGVTGTNGKTTVTTILKQALEYLGHKTGLIGTIENHIGDTIIPAKHTTPDPAELHVLLRRMKQAGCEYVVMEASSHALDQQRLAGCHFAVGVFTNLTQDHLDYHKNMENYLMAKKKLFSMCDTAILNLDDPYYTQMAQGLICKQLTFSTSNITADYSAQNIQYQGKGVRFACVKKGAIGRVDFCMPGEFSVSNALAVLASGVSLGIAFDKMVDALNHTRGVRGRTEVLYTNEDFTIICDYAHSPDGLEKVLKAIKNSVEGRVVVVFGSAGERDRTKRPKMGQAVAKYADYIYLTSDNPRSEDPMQIIHDTEKGFKGYSAPYEINPNRYESIKKALKNAKKGDIILLAGKGHEDYQVLKDGTIYFDEHTIVKELLHLQ